MLTMLWVLSQIAHAGAFEEDIARARAAVKSGDARALETACDAAKEDAEKLDHVANPANLARIWFYRGLLAKKAGDDDAAMEAWRNALVLDVDFQWEEDLMKDDLSQDLFEALRKEVQARPRHDAGVPDQIGAAKAYVDGQRVQSGDKVIEGRHLVQMDCPPEAGDGVHGRWWNYTRDKAPKWLKLCPGTIDTSVVVAEANTEDDEFAGMGPVFGVSASGVLGGSATSTAGSAPSEAAPSAEATEPSTAPAQSAKEAQPAVAQAEPPAASSGAASSPAESKSGIRPDQLPPGATMDENGNIYIRKEIHWPFLIAAGGTLVASGIVYSMALHDSNAYDDLNNPDVQTVDDLRALARKTNREVLASAALGGLSAGMYVAAFVQW